FNFALGLEFGRTDHHGITVVEVAKGVRAGKRGHCNGTRTNADLGRSIRANPPNPRSSAFEDPPSLARVTPGWPIFGSPGSPCRRCRRQGMRRSGSPHTKARARAN